jgi:RNA recognition motif-containing protein
MFKQSESFERCENYESAQLSHQPSMMPIRHLNNSSTQRRPNDLFVGNLSYFCREKDLLDLFAQHGQVLSGHIVYNDQRTRSLMYGFVTMSTEAEARSVATTLNNQIFMGRTIK